MRIRPTPEFDVVVVHIPKVDGGALCADPPPLSPFDNATYVFAQQSKYKPFQSLVSTGLRMLSYYLIPSSPII